MAHANFEFGETSDGHCVDCGSRTALISFLDQASVDQEPFESGEFSDESPEAKCGIEIPDEVMVNDEITGHFCLKCETLTTLCINTPGRRNPMPLNPEIEATLFKLRMADRGVDVEVKIKSIEQ